MAPAEPFEALEADFLGTGLVAALALVLVLGAVVFLTTFFTTTGFLALVAGFLAATAFFAAGLFCRT